MTTRVFDLWRPRQMLLPPRRRGVPERGRGRPARDLAAAAVIALVLVPVVGAAERPAGFLFAGVSAAVVLLVAILCGSRFPWSWLTLVAALLGFALPRDPWPAIGPALFVATVLCAFLWLRQPGPNRRRTSDRPEPGSRERAAQVMLGLSGERQVGHFLADALPQEYALLNGLTLPAGAGDIDHLVVGPTGVFLLETKTMAGHIVCAPDGSWHRTRVGRAGTPYQAYIGNPAHQVARNIFAVRQTLRRRLPASLTSMLWIEGLLVFPHPRTELETRNSRVPAVLLDETVQRICEHVPRWRLRSEEVDAVVAALLEEGKAGSNRALANRHSAQALVELAVLLPAVLTLAFATVGISRIVQTHSAVVAIAQQAARAGALASNPAEARIRMQTRAETVAGGLGLDARLLALDWDLSQFAHNPGTVEVRVSYPVTLSDLPLIGELVAPVVSADHVEWVDPFRSGVQVVPASTR